MTLPVNLNGSREARMMQAASALLVAAYDPITFPANWATDIGQLSPMARERLVDIVKAAVEAVPGGTDEAAALAFLKAVSVNRSTLVT